MGKTCIICGKPSGMYPLCKECNILKDNGKILKCDNCGKWHKVNEPCDCNEKIEKENIQKKEFEREIAKQEKTNNILQESIEKYKNLLEKVNKELETTKEELVNSNQNQNSKCIICNEEANGFLFCKNCYNKYKNKSIYIKIDNCENVELASEDYEGHFVCTDGHIVKSKDEKAIDDYLYYNNIMHVYEKAVPIDEDAKHDLKPDFYIPSKGVYIEHFGIIKNQQYEKQKAYKIEKYKQLGLTIICTFPNDMNDVNATFERKLRLYKEKEINFLI